MKKIFCFSYFWTQNVLDSHKTFCLPRPSTGNVYFLALGRYFASMVKPTREISNISFVIPGTSWQGSLGTQQDSPNPKQVNQPQKKIYVSILNMFAALEVALYCRLTEWLGDT